MRQRSPPFLLCRIYSLEELVTKRSRVCVINILGTESRKSARIARIQRGQCHGGSPVRSPAYSEPHGRHRCTDSVRDVMKHGHAFE